jgi:hypothetical protein
LSNSNEVYRSTNKYINFNTGEEILWYGRMYDTTGKARSYATLYREAKKTFRSARSGTFEEFEFVETWCERAKEWERV